MHVIQFLDPLLPAPYIEIIKPPLPETAMHRGILPQTHLSRRRLPTNPPPQPPRHPLLQHLHHHRRIRLLRLPNQQMNVLRHHYIPDDYKPIAPPHLIENDQKRIPRPHRPQKRQSPITTERNKMQLRSPIAPLKIFWHRSKPTPPHPSQTQRKMGHPQKPRLNLEVTYPSGIILTEAPSIVETTHMTREGKKQRWARNFERTINVAPRRRTLGLRVLDFKP